MASGSRPDQLRERIATFEIILAPRDGQQGEDKVELYGFRHLCMRGIPDHPPALRATAWRLLLGLTSPQTRSGWPAELERKRKEYCEIRDMLVSRAVQQPPVDPRASLTPDDHRLSQIDRDVRRTQGALAFFARPLAGSKVSALAARLDQLNPDRLDHHSKDAAASSNSIPYSKTPSSAQTIPTTPSASRTTPMLCLDVTFPTVNVQAPSPTVSPGSPGHSGLSPTKIAGPPSQIVGEETFRDALTRLLFVYASLNPGVGYVQGMSELAAVVLYVFARAEHGSEEKDKSWVEADAFWALTALMGEVRDLFVRSLDGALTSPALSDPSSPAAWSRIGRSSPLSPLAKAQSPSRTGIGALLQRFSESLTWLDPRLAAHLHQQGVEPTFYAFRWLTCLCAQDFALPDVIRIWDTFLALLTGSSSSAAPSLNPDAGVSSLDFMVDFCCILVSTQRERLLNSGFAGCLGALQRVGHELALNPEASDGGVDGLIEKALEVRQRRLVDSMMPSPNLGDDLGDSWLGDDGKGVGWEEYEGEDSFSSGAGWTAMSNFASRFRGAKNTTTFPPSGRRDSMDSTSTSYSAVTAPAALGGGLFGKYREVMKTKAEAWKDTDAAAALSKQATNWTIAATSWKKQAPSALSKLQAPSASSLVHLSAKVGTGSSSQPPSPPNAPFQPPAPFLAASHSRQDSLTSSSGSSTPMRQGGSNGPKPLLLSASARKAQPGESDSSHHSRRASLAPRSPQVKPRSLSPVPPSFRSQSPGPSLTHLRASSHQFEDRGIPILSRARSPSFNNLAVLRSPASLDDIPLRSARFGSGLGHGSNANRSANPYRRNASEGATRHHRDASPSAVPAANGRGWTLTDGPAPTTDSIQSTLDAPPAEMKNSGSTGSHARMTGNVSEAAPLARAVDYCQPHSHSGDLPFVSAAAIPDSARKPRSSSLTESNGGSAGNPTLGHSELSTKHTGVRKFSSKRRGHATSASTSSAISADDSLAGPNSAGGTGVFANEQVKALSAVESSRNAPYSEEWDETDLLAAYDLSAPTTPQKADV